MIIIKLSDNLIIGERPLQNNLDNILYEIKPNVIVNLREHSTSAEWYIDKIYSPIDIIRKELNKGDCFENKEELYEFCKTIVNDFIKKNGIVYIHSFEGKGRAGLVGLGCLYIIKSEFNPNFNPIEYVKNELHEEGIPENQRQIDQLNEMINHHKKRVTFFGKK